jgi:hypothetical protein
MGQATLDDELFTEAASEMRADVETSLAQARQELPSGDDIWEADASNTLGVLNAMRSALELEAATDHLRDAKKWYTMGEKADAFDDGDDLAAEIEAVADVVAEVEAAGEQVGEPTSTIPQLKSALDEIETETDASDADADGETETDADAESDADAEPAEA